MFVYFLVKAPSALRERSHDVGALIGVVLVVASKDETFLAVVEAVVSKDDMIVIVVINYVPFFERSPLRPMEPGHRFTP
jgi:hypothetical protein